MLIFMCMYICILEQLLHASSAYMSLLHTTFYLLLIAEPTMPDGSAL